MAGHMLEYVLESNVHPFLGVAVLGSYEKACPELWRPKREDKGRDSEREKGSYITGNY